MLSELVLLVSTPSLVVVVRTGEQLVVSAYQAWPAPVLGAPAQGNIQDQGCQSQWNF